MRGQGKRSAKRELKVSRIIGRQAVRPCEGEHVVEGAGGCSMINLKWQSVQQPDRARNSLTVDTAASFRHREAVRTFKIPQ